MAFLSRTFCAVRFTVGNGRAFWRCHHSSIPPQPLWSVKQLVGTETGGEHDEVTAETVARLARLTHLSILPSENEQVQRQIRTLLHFVGCVQNVDTTGVEPLQSLLEDTELYLRADITARRASAEGMLVAAPESIENYYVAPKEEHFETRDC
eukprot:m.455048 g.455048  ORF g.455048 m.455048 type:complete len:152 (+) comp20799_c0_seq1:103-558(+)